MQQEDPRGSGVGATLTDVDEGLRMMAGGDVGIGGSSFSHNSMGGETTERELLWAHRKNDRV